MIPPTIKVLKIISSCKNQQHLEVAAKVARRLILKARNAGLDQRELAYIIRLVFSTYDKKVKELEKENVDVSKRCN